MKYKKIKSFQPMKYKEFAWREVNKIQLLRNTPLKSGKKTD